MPLTSYLETVQPKGIADVLNSKAGQLSKIIHERGDAEVKAMLSKQIIGLHKFFNFARVMDQDQVMETVDLIIEAYPIFTPEDFVICFKKIKMLKYGKFFEGIDGAKILEMIGKYDVDRDAEITAVRQKESNQYKSEGKHLPDAVADAAKKILDLTTPKHQPTPPRERTELEKQMDAFMSEFDQLHAEQKDGHHLDQGMRFVDFGGRRIDLQTYCNQRFFETQ